MNIFMRFSWILLTVFLVFTSTAPFAVAQVVNIPDANLRARVEAFLSKYPNEIITVSDMKTLILLSAVNADIRDLTGLEHATNLLWLELYDNAISDITPLVFLPRLSGLYLDNNPLSAESVDTHVPELFARGVDVSYTLPSDLNRDGMVNIQDLVSVTQHFGSSGNLTADVTGDGVVDIRDLTQVAGDIGVRLVVNPATTDAMDTAPSEAPVRDEAFIFRKFLEQLLSDWKAAVPSIVYDETIFQTPGKGFQVPNRGAHYGFRPSRWKVLGIFVPDVLFNASVQQVNRFSREYNLTEEEFINLLRNLQYARILVLDPLRHVVYMPDENLRKVVVAKINELGISLGPINRPKEPSDPIYAGEMWRIEELRAEAAGIEDLTGLEYATDLNTLLLGNIAAWNWEENVGPEMPNKISDLTPLEELTNLTFLNLNLNRISRIASLENLTNLTILDITHNWVEDLTPLRNLTNLRALFLTGNEITNIGPLARLTNLEQLETPINKISDLTPLGNLTNLKQLVIGDNGISDLTPLGNLTNLERLDVAASPIGSSISIVRNFPKLKWLNILCCGVSDLSPLVESLGLRAGSHARVVANPLTEANVPDIEALKDRGVGVAGPTYWVDEEGIIRDFKNYLEWCSERSSETYRSILGLTQ